ncbi:MAG: cytidine deaminase [Candidatus Eremiobacteraeota bacterium]|nr:cytidine deaminase [Candidatus Eremiobacteraeota bacterium]
MNAPDAAMLAPGDAQARAAAAGIDTDTLMTALLPWAASFAHVPVSGFSVGAVALGRSGALYAGANLELAQMPLSASVHAEQAAVANAWLNGEEGLVALAVTAAPCGHCRQFLSELNDAARLRILIAEKTPATLGELLPAAFGPADLGVNARLLETADHGLAAAPSGDELATSGDDDLASAALSAANASYAPYTRAYAGIALRLRDATVVTGRYAECAAYNPSLPALQAALVALRLRRVDASVIVDAVLAEAPGASSQRTAAAAALRTIAGIPLRYLTVSPGAARI